MENCPSIVNYLRVIILVTKHGKTRLAFMFFFTKLSSQRSNFIIDEATSQQYKQFKCSLITVLSFNYGKGLTMA